MKRPFSCRPGIAHDALRELVVAHLDALALGLEHGDLLVHHLRQHLLIDAELPQQLRVHLAAELLLVGLHLRDVALLELAREQIVAVHRRDGLARRGAGGAVSRCRKSGCRK
jgi:hypothetical protein